MSGAVEPPPGEFEVTRVSAAMKSPSEPIADEVERHEAAGHLPFRAWCRACVLGCGASAAHRDLSAELSHSMPTVSVDYMFLCSEVDEDRAAPIVAKVAHSTRVKSSRVAPRKVPCRGLLT